MSSLLAGLGYSMDNDVCREASKLPEAAELPQARRAGGTRGRLVESGQGRLKQTSKAGMQRSASADVLSW